MSMEFCDYKKTIHEMHGKLNMYKTNLKGSEILLIEKKEDASNIEKAQVFVQQVAKETQEQLRFQISDIVQLALDTCFPDEYEFDVKFEIKRGKTEASLIFLKNGNEVDPMTASGGGVVDLSAFALRIATWSLGHSDNVIVLDEPLKWLQPRELQKRGFEMIKRLSQKLNLQFIIISNSVNNEDISEIADKVFTVVKKDGVSKVTVKEDL